MKGGAVTIIKVSHNTISYANGDIYEGQWKDDGIKEGKGK
tara:strand:- start:49 stop:168 length:120 start_codon:yes stop_codon:yes gene_type:complete